MIVHFSSIEVQLLKHGLARLLIDSLWTAKRRARHQWLIATLTTLSLLDVWWHSGSWKRIKISCWQWNICLLSFHEIVHLRGSIASLSFFCKFLKFELWNLNLRWSLAIHAAVTWGIRLVISIDSYKLLRSYKVHLLERFLSVYLAICAMLSDHLITS